MPKPTQERSTSNGLGQKINAVMREQGFEGDYARLAKVFNVKTPSVYDWIDHGRLGKERYAKLVEWSERNLDWWFDIPALPATQYSRANSQSATVTMIRDTDQQSSIVALPPLHKSPFRRIADDQWAALPPESVREIEAFALGMIAGLGARSDVKRSNGAHK